MRLGVDLQSVSRFRRIAQHPRMRGCLFTERELAQAEGLAPERYAERLAGRFSAKEATCKVLGRGFGQGVRWRDIEIVSNEWGAPLVFLSGGARAVADRAGLTRFQLTLSHQADLVIAVAAAEELPERRPDNGSGGKPTLKREVSPIMSTPTLSNETSRLHEIATIAADLFTVSVDEVKEAESFVNDLGTDSLLAIELLCQLEKRFDVQIDEGQAPLMVNLRGTYDVVAEIAGW
ncbi:4'-phosphopantetheinyl transferase superfamily protein [Streptomyces sp. NPDC006482]|uniref:4'-phosphopantetheinyl transferase superfamily protein n=1 Tax=unclassified Streptomyces TaxID=2593676 RepID=UPI002256D089|nr:4'-phosphopantetheinyl transferase superfamily protein [Streptomyces sp. NBC_00094]MCX5391931.1 4'-phosphopantetheinyl transferase superfamily protein [Streptomyces sp. NBC_00094]